MAQIFLSYAREDLPWASRLASELFRRGWSVFWDRYIPTGKSFDQVIEHELDGALCVVVLWSQHSIASNWVRIEASEGARRGILHPAWIENVKIEDVKIPLQFRQLQAAHLADWGPEAQHDEFDRLVDDIARTLGAMPVVSTHPVEPEVWGSKLAATIDAEPSPPEPIWELSTAAEAQTIAPISDVVEAIAGGFQEASAEAADADRIDSAKSGSRSRRSRADKKINPPVSEPASDDLQGEDLGTIEPGLSWIEPPSVPHLPALWFQPRAIEPNRSEGEPVADVDGATVWFLILFLTATGVAFMVAADIVARR